MRKRDLRRVYEAATFITARRCDIYVEPFTCITEDDGVGPWKPCDPCALVQAGVPVNTLLSGAAPRTAPRLGQPEIDMPLTVEPTEGAIFLESMVAVPRRVVQAALNVGGYDIVGKPSERIKNVLAELVAADEAQYEHERDCHFDPKPDESCPTCFTNAAVLEGLFAKARLTLRNT